MESKTVELNGREYVLNKIPAFQAQKLSFYCFKAFKDKDMASIPDEVLMKLISYIGVMTPGGAEVRLSSEEYITLNVPDAGVLMNLELQLLEFNYGFFFDGSLLKTVSDIFQRILPPKSDAADVARTDTSKA